MNVRSFARLAPHALVTLVAGSLGLLLPACDCAGNTNPLNVDAGDTGILVDTGPPRDTGPDTGPRPDANADANADGGPSMTDGGMCSNPETCNGTDDDCDGMVDENIVATCGMNIGICRTGTQTCSAGTLGTCTGEVMPMASDVCGNGQDDDCDEMVDEGCTCTDGATQSCGSGVGECRRGTQTCASSAWGACVGEVTPTAELCDGLDNNCDGMIDETFAGIGGACDGPDADMCLEGTLACSVDHLSTTCSDMTGDNVETCNGTDDNCDGRVDEGCTCVDGTMQVCGMMVGACTTGMQTCAGGVWGVCSGVGPMTETCNGADDNCNGMTDEGFMLGMACDGPDADLCTEGVLVCSAAGGTSCNDATGDTVETCNGMDDDCDGSIDEGNPGGVTTMTGTCATQTFCMGGALVTRGTFVASAGTATSPGSTAMPLNSISAAILNAVAIGGGADVCVCDPTGGATSTFTENVTMVEGVSVLGGLDCGTWALGGATNVTAIQDTDVDGLTFPAGITSITSLDHMTVLGFMSSSPVPTSAAVTITDSSPTLSTDTVRAGPATTNAIGLRVVHSAAATSPTITNGNYSATGSVGGTATAVSIEGASPHFMTVTINGAAPSGLAGSPTTSFGVNCTACAGTTFMGGNVAGGSATTSATGFAGTGDLTGLTAMTTGFFGGITSANSSTSAGVALTTCTGAPAFTTVNANGGANAAGTVPTMTTRTAFSSTGAACAPVIDGGRYVGCEAGVTCLGIDANTGSQLVVRNVTPGAGGAPVGIQATTGAVDTGIGMRCRAGSCASISNSTIAVGNLTRTGPTGVGLWIEGSSPAVDSNRITGPNAQASVAVAPLQLDALLLRGTTTSVVSNNVIHDGSHALRVLTVLYDMTPGAAGGGRGPTVVNNTIDYNPCALCGPRVGLVFFSNLPTTPSGVFRNNIVHNVGAGGMTNPVFEANVNSDPLVFENNALFDATAMGGTLYLDEAATSLTTAAGINALNGMPATATYGGNLVVDCMVNATFHIPMASMCVNTGTAMSCPAHDFDVPASPRPTGAMCDIGADEFVP